MIGRRGRSFGRTLEYMRYRDRVDAGRQLAAAVRSAGYPDGRPLLVLGVARGGVPVAAEVAAGLDCDVDVAVARKIGAPGNPEFALGAIAAGGDPIIDERLLAAHRIPRTYVDDAVVAARAEIERRTTVYRAGRAAVDPSGITVVVVDDGVATGATLKAVLRSVRDADAARVVCAVPVGPPDTVEALQTEADEVICPLQPPLFRAVGNWYEDFAQLQDAEVVAALRATGTG